MYIDGIAMFVLVLALLYEVKCLLAAFMMNVFVGDKSSDFLVLDPNSSV